MSDRPLVKRYAHPGGRHWIEVKMTYSRRLGRLAPDANTVEAGLAFVQPDGTQVSTELYPLFAGARGSLPAELDKQYTRHPTQKTINKVAAAYFETPECLALVEKAKEIAASRGYWP